MATRSDVLRKLICEREYRRAAIGRRRLYAALALAATSVGLPLLAQQDEAPERKAGRVATVASDVKDYVTAPLHARRQQWARFGVALGAVALAHEYDDDVREHFETVTVPQGTKADTNDCRDAEPAGLALCDRWSSAVLDEEAAGRRAS